MKKIGKEIENITKEIKILENKKKTLIDKKEQFLNFLSNPWWNKEVHKILFDKLNSYNWHCFKTLHGTESCSWESGVYRVANALLNNKFIICDIRNWESKMKSIVTRNIFPNMVIFEYINNNEYWKYKIWEIKSLWECNELEVK